METPDFQPGNTLAGAVSGPHHAVIWFERVRMFTGERTVEEGGGRGMG